MKKQQTRRLRKADPEERLPGGHHRAMLGRILVEGTQEGEAGITVTPAQVPITLLKDGTRISCEGYKQCYCPKHRGALLPMADFGYRRMGNGLIRPQAYCKESR